MWDGLGETVTRCRSGTEKKNNNLVVSATVPAGNAAPLYDGTVGQIPQTQISYNGWYVMMLTRTAWTHG